MLSRYGNEKDSNTRLLHSGLDPKVGAVNVKCCRGVLARLSCSCSAALEGMASTVLSSSLEMLSMPSTSDIIENEGQ